MFKCTCYLRLERPKAKAVYSKVLGKNRKGAVACSFVVHLSYPTSGIAIQTDNIEEYIESPTSAV
jgi:hypothetical protein